MDCRFGGAARIGWNHTPTAPMGTGSGSGTTVEVYGGVGAIGAGQVINRLRSLGFPRDDIGDSG